jgi:hypothetical protein
MKRTKYYFRKEDSERCYTIDKHMDDAREEGLTEITLFEAKRQKLHDFIYCHAVDECGEKGECGKCCGDYQPRNGKSGMCKNQGLLYEPSKEVKFKVQ